MSKLVKEKNLWELIKRFYRETFGIPEDIIEYLSLLDIMKRCAMGYSITYIADHTRLPPSYIKEALEFCFSFPGWSLDLDFNALALYNRSNGNYTAYVQEVSMVSAITNTVVIRMSYNICKNYYEILKEIDKYVI